jgi:hypothetical protein
MTRVAALLLGSLLIAGCAERDHGNAVTEAACRQRADQIYSMRHPEQQYADDTYATSLRDAPFGTSGSPSVPTYGLSGEYERQQMLADCERGVGPVGPTPAAPAAGTPAPLAAPKDGP